MSSPRKTAVIIGAGPAGLTAAYELLTRTDIRPVIYEASADIGGISKTVNYKGNRIDIGGHRFFSKSDRVMAWWRALMPIESRDGAHPETFSITYRQHSRMVTAEGRTANPATEDLVMLVRHRLSRILFLRQLFDYPIRINVRTARSLGAWRIVRILASYLRARLTPIAPEQSLEDHFINRFGRELYLTFFKDYTEKVWGAACADIKPEWGAQRIKGLSVTQALVHAARALVRQDRTLAQKDVETSLIERFLYPKLGPGQLWEEVARQVVARGGIIHLRHACVGVDSAGVQIHSVAVRDLDAGRVIPVTGDYFFSTMPIKELVASMTPEPPADVRQVAAGLRYRDFITVGLLVRKMKLAERGDVGGSSGRVRDNWIYIQERDVRIGRLQIFNNWSPFMVHDHRTVWLGLEYFCNKGDDLWSMTDDAFIRFAVEELARIEIIDPTDVLDATVIRMEKTYPAYLGTYDRFDVVRRYLDDFDNLFLIGRNGMHRYNNSDHSMLTAMTAVDNIIAGVTAKDAIWAVNTEQEYHEEQSESHANRASASTQR